MIERKTIVSQITLDEFGNLLIQLSLLIVEDGIEIGRKYHRTAIPAETPPELQMGAVNTHLAQMGEIPVSQEENAFIAGVHAFSKSNTPQRASFRRPGQPQ